MSDSEILDRIMNYNPQGTRRAGRPKVRWIGVVNNYVRRQVLEIGG
jgi:hypothetical protein